jgi:hypothetical protein
MVLLEDLLRMEADAIQILEGAGEAFDYTCVAKLIHSKVCCRPGPHMTESQIMSALAAHHDAAEGAE